MKAFKRSGFAVMAALTLTLSSGTFAATTSAAARHARHVPATPKNVQQLTAFTNLTKSGKKINANLTVAFSQTDLNTPWRVSEQQNYTTWAKKLGVNLITTNANEDVGTQLSNVQELLARHPNVLIVDPEATKPLTPVINMATSAHVPLIVVDRALSMKPGQGEYQLFIGANQFVIGYQSATWWVKKLQQVQHTKSPKANLAIIMGGVGQDPAIERNQGVMAAIKGYPHIKIVAMESGDWTLQGGRQVMEAYIQRFKPGTLQGVFCASDEMMLGAQEALKAAHRTDVNGWFFTGDGQLQGLQQIVAKNNIADTQNPPFYGEASLQAAIAISEGVKFNGATINLNNETFTYMTKSELAKVKAYIKLIQGQHSLF